MTYFSPSYGFKTFKKNQGSGGVLALLREIMNDATGVGALH